MICEGCAERRENLKVLLLKAWGRVARRTRIIFGVQQYLQYQGTYITKLLNAGSELEHQFAAHEKAVAQWLEKLTQDVKDLSAQNSALRTRVAYLEGQLSDLKQSLPVQDETT